MIHYRIQKRKYAPNIIEEGTEWVNDKGKTEITWVPYLAPLVNKKKGDVICENILKHLTA